MMGVVFVGAVFLVHDVWCCEHLWCWCMMFVLKCVVLVLLVMHV